MIFESSMDKTCDYSQWKKNLEGEKHWDKHGTILGINMFLEKKHDFDVIEIHDPKTLWIWHGRKTSKTMYELQARKIQVHDGNAIESSAAGKLVR